jgi:hypothetical protein
MLVTSLFLAAADSKEVASKTVRPPGVWAKKAYDLTKRPYETAAFVPAPRKSCDAGVRITGTTLSVIVGSSEKTQSGRVGAIAELLWAPDCKSFAITQSEGGAAGPYIVDVFSIGMSGEITDVYLWPVMKPVTRLDSDCEANIAAVGWKNGDEIVVITQVPPQASCKNQGRIRGYLVSVNHQRILKSFTHSQLVRSFGKQLSSFITRGHN